MTDREHSLKRARLRALLDAEDLDALVLRRPANLAWYFRGGRFHIVATPRIGIADLVVSRDGDEIVTTCNEAPRLEAEELPRHNARLRVLAWDENRESHLPIGERVGSDGTLAGTRDVSDAVQEARRSLTPEEMARYRTLGRDAATALAVACSAMTPVDSEHKAAAKAAGALLERSLEPIVLLVAGQSRLPHHRHPLPTSADLGTLAMVAVCARRHGLIASLTRFVSFGAVPTELRARHTRLLRVDAAINAATVPGRRVGDVFRVGVEAYAREGFAGDEWQRHHQGGPTGYETRDYLATFQSTAVIGPNQAFAWNPSVPALKSEDTILSLESGPEVLTADSSWPTAAVDGLRRPLILER